MNEQSQDKKKFSGLIWVIIFVAILGWYFRDSISTWRTSQTTPAHEISAIQLMKEYSENEIAADLKFKDKVIIVSGKVTDRSKDLLNQIYIALYSGKALFSVQCFFADKYASEVAAVKTGSALRIKGRVDGKLGNVLLNGCQIIK